MFDRISSLKARVIRTIMWEFLPEALLFAGIGAALWIIYVVLIAAR
jgi:hypothetical protein